MSGCDPKLKQIAQLAIDITVIDFGIPTDGGARTTERQNKLFKIGRSKCDGTIKKSKHQIRRDETFCQAIDFFAIDPDTGKASWKPDLLSMVACSFLQAACELGYNIQWGGLWKSFKDMPHIQLVNEFDC